MASSTFKINFFATRQKISGFDLLEFKMIEKIKKIILSLKSLLESLTNFLKGYKKNIIKINLTKFLPYFDFQKVFLKLNIKKLLETL